MKRAAQSPRGANRYRPLGPPRLSALTISFDMGKPLTSSASAEGAGALGPGDYHTQGNKAALRAQLVLVRNRKRGERRTIRYFQLSIDIMQVDFYRSFSQV
jgi:hypothetical protein